MEQREQAVWQRVFAPAVSTAQQEDPAELLRNVRELAAIYAQLMTQTSGKDRQRLQQLHRGELANLNCLKGVAALTGFSPGKLPPLSPKQEPFRKALAGCCHRTRRAILEYTARSSHPETGILFRQMALREEQQYALAAELLGSMLP
jgi:hypothetical protein